MMATIERWLAEPVPEDVERALQRLARTHDVQRIAVMPDVHLAHDVCVGVATATRGTLYPQAVGGDIGCGIAAIGFEHGPTDIDETVAARIFDGLYRLVPQNRFRVRDGVRPWPAGLQPERLSHGSLRRLAEREGQCQLGTLGRGNHFLELQAGDDGRLWVMVHSGSRAMGPAIRDWHLRRATEHGLLRGLDADDDLGRAYFADVGWALAYAEANRARMLEAVAKVIFDHLGVEPVPALSLACHHNFVRQETHDEVPLWVHRKGAISARPGEHGIIAGSMGTPSYHVCGRGCGASLRSSSHGAGRVLSRAQARRSISLRDLGRQMRGVWFDHRHAPRLRDEAPGAYKDITMVMRAQRDLVRIERRLRPLLSYKGG